MKAPRDAGSTPATSTVLRKDRLVRAVFSYEGTASKEGTQSWHSSTHSRKSDRVRMGAPHNSDRQPRSVCLGLFGSVCLARSGLCRCLAQHVDEQSNLNARADHLLAPLGMPESEQVATTSNAIGYQDKTSRAA